MTTINSCRYLFSGCLCLFISVTFFSLRAQNIDSLKQLVASTDVDTVWLLGNYRLAVAYERSNLDSTLWYADQLVERCIEFENKIPAGFRQRNYYKFYQIRANVLMQRGDDDLASQAFSQAISIAEETNNANGKVLVMTAYGSLLIDTDPDSALSIITKNLLELDTALHKDQHKAWLINSYNHSRVFNRNGQHDQAAKTLISILSYPRQEVVDLYRYAILNSLGITLKKNRDFEGAAYYFQLGLKQDNIPVNYNGMLLYNLANLYYTQMQLDSAESYVRKLLKVPGLAANYQFRGNKLLGDIYLDHQKWEIAEKYLEQAEPLLAELQNPDLDTDLLFTRLTIAIHQERYAEAEKYVIELQAQAKQHPNFFETEEQVLLTQKELEIALGKRQWEQAELLLAKFSLLRDTLELERLAIQVQDAKNKYETEKKETENVLLRKQSSLDEAIIKRQQLFIWTVIVGFLGAIVVIVLALKLARERKRSNEQLKIKNQQIQELHQEQDHRVKNNLAFISSLMRMHIRRLDHPGAKRAIKEGESRLQAMTLLYRKLSLQETTSVNLARYLEEITQYLLHTYPLDGPVPEINITVGDLILDADTAMRVGLIINELVTNSFKHAFKNCGSPKILIEVHQVSSQHYRLSYADNGSGFADVSMGKNSSLGLKLVHMLTQQLHGEVTISDKQNSKYVISFSQPNTEKSQILLESRLHYEEAALQQEIKSV